MGKVTNLKIPVVFSKKLCWQPPFFYLMAKFINSKAISDEIFVSVESWTTLFHIDPSFRYGLFMETLCQIQ